MLAWLVLAVVLGACAGQEVPRVETPFGTYLGKERQAPRKHDKKFFAFEGIPYAKPPIGDLRFRNPLPVGPLDKPFEAFTTPPECLQWDHLRERGVVGSEDCLYLNVYTNRIPPPPTYANTQPTLVFLHAGTYTAGSGADGLFQPDYLVETDITVVTISHRLGPLGFLCTEDAEAPGNVGLRDQLLALEWVRDNIRYFGGMNDSVTVMGSGAGGSSAHLLTLTPLIRADDTNPNEFSLLHRIISHSGTAYTPGVLHK